MPDPAPEADAPEVDAAGADEAGTPPAPCPGDWSAADAAAARVLIDAILSRHGAAFRDLFWRAVDTGYNCALRPDPDAEAQPAPRTRLRRWNRIATGRPAETEAPAQARTQWAMSTGMPACSMTWRVTPPSRNSRTRLCV